MVAGNKLGAINHTLLTVEALKKRKINILGIVFNNLADGGDKIIMDDNPKIIKRISGERVFGALKFSKNKTEAQTFIDFMTSSTARLIFEKYNYTTKPIE